jgi:tetratricopeptide (TPR) repeat protein
VLALRVQDSLVEYGIILLSMKRYDESIQVFEDALLLRQIEGDDAENSEAEQEAKLKMAKIRHNIGCVNFELGNLERAKRNYMDAIEGQRAIFGSWTNPFMMMTDTSKPGYLTMASTMCNKGKDAVKVGLKRAVYKSLHCVST